MPGAAGAAAGGAPPDPTHVLALLDPTHVLSLPPARGLQGLPASALSIAHLLFIKKIPCSSIDMVDSSIDMVDSSIDMVGTSIDMVGPHIDMLAANIALMGPNTTTIPRSMGPSRLNPHPLFLKHR